MHFAAPAIVFALILGGGVIAHTATGSPAVLFAVSGGVFLVGLFARNLVIALPVAIGTGLVTFALALQGFVPWIGVAEALFLVAWAGSANVQRPIPAALAAGFFGSLVLAFEVWRGWTGDMLSYDLRPFLAIGAGVAGFLLLFPARRDHSPRPLEAVPMKHPPKRAPFLRAFGAIVSISLLIALTVALVSPMGTFAAHLREALGGPPVEGEITEIPIAGGGGSSWSSDSGRPLPRRANVDLKHEFELLVRADTKGDAARLAGDQIYCRSAVFERYSAGRWLPPAENEWFEDPDDGTIDNHVHIAPDPPSWIKPVTHTVYVPVSPEIILPALQGVTSFQLPRVIRIGDSMFGHPSRLESALSYRAKSATRRVKDIPPDQLRPNNIGSSESELALQLPAGRIGGRIRALASSLSAPGTPLPVIIDRIRRHLGETTSYSTTIKNPKDLPPLENFLFEERRGYCEFYATAGAHLLRASGIRARVAFGYSGGEQTADPLAFAFFSDDAHAWTEVQVDGIGWCVVDFTPEGEGAARAPEAAGPLATRVDRESFPSLSEIDAEATGNWIATASSAGWNWNGTIATITASLLLGGILTVLARRDTKTQTGDTDPRDPLPAPPRELGFYRSFCDAAAKAGVPKRPGQTPKEHLTDLAYSSPEHAEGFAELVDYYYAVRYEGAEANRNRERAFKGAAGKLSKS